MDIDEFKRNFKQARYKTEKYLEETGTKKHMFYGPASDKYWSAPLRVLLLNMEPYGYEKCDLVNVDYDVLKQWLFDAGKTRTRTVRNSISIAYTLIEAVYNGKEPSEEAMRKAYQCRDLLESALQTVAYYNIRPTSNSEKPQDGLEICNSGLGEISKLIRAELKALEPHVIFVSGKAGLAAFNAMWDTQLRFRQRHWDGKTVIQSIRHPSRISYSESSKMIAEVAKCVKETGHATVTA